MAQRIVVQTKLGIGNSRMVCWLPLDSRVKVGSVISLQKGGERWTVLEQFGRTDAVNIRHGWPVGGL